MNLVDRIKNILLQPKSEWAAIEREPGDAGYLFSNYVAIVAAIPPVCILSILGLYSLYLLHTGLVALMRPTPDRALVYTIAVIVCVVIVWVVIFAVPAALFGVGMMM